MPAQIPKIRAEEEVNILIFNLFGGQRAEVGAVNIKGVPNLQEVLGFIASEFLQQPVQPLQLGRGHRALAGKQPGHFRPVARRPELGLPFSVVVPADHLVCRQGSVNGGLLAEVEALECPQIEPGELFRRSRGFE